MTQRQLAEKCNEPVCLNISPSLRVVASSAAEPATRAAVATYESAIVIVILIPSRQFQWHFKTYLM